MNENSLTGLELSDAMNELLRSAIVQNEADGFGGIDAAGDACQFGGRYAEILRISTKDGESDNGIAERETRHFPSQLVDDANHVVARRKRQRRHVGVHAVAHEDVGKGHARGQDLQTDFMDARFGEIFLDYFEDFGAAVSGDQDARVLHERIGCWGGWGGCRWRPFCSLGTRIRVSSRAVA